MMGERRYKGTTTPLQDLIADLTAAWGTFLTTHAPELVTAFVAISIPAIVVVAAVRMLRKGANKAANALR